MVIKCKEIIMKIVKGVKRSASKEQTFNNFDNDFHDWQINGRLYDTEIE